MQETNEVKDDVTLEETVAENLKDEQVATEEVQPAQDGEAVAEGQPKKKNGLKNFIQLVLFILLSMAGFIVQMIIEQVGEKLPPIINLNEQTFNLFGLEQAVGSFIITMIAVFVCKLINFILHRKVLFKARANLGFSIAMYLIFSIVLWIGSAAVKAPVKNALLANEWWAAHDPDGGWAVLIAVMVYSTADLIIMFFAEKFLIMNDKLFKKGKEQAAEGDGVAIEGESDANAVSEEGAVAVAADVATDEIKETDEVQEVKEPEVADSQEEIVILSQNEDLATPEEPVKVETEEVKSEEEPSAAPVLSLEEAAEVAQEEVMQEEIKQEEQAAAEAKPAKKAPAKKTTTAAKKTSTATKKTTSTAKASAAKSTASKTTGAKKSTSTAAKKSATVKATATKAPAKKTTSATAKKTTAASKSTTAKKTTSTAKKTTAAKAEENKD